MAKPRSKFKKVKWLFGKEIEVPEEWKLERLGNVCKIRKSSSISSDLYIGLEHIGQGNNLIESTGNVNEFTSTKNTFSQGDVLYGKLRPLLNKVWLATESGYCSTDILPLVPTNKILSQILLFVLTNHDFLWYAVGTSAGTKMPRTSWSDMKKFPVVLSNIQEQQKIASIFSGVDALIESTQEVIAKTERLKKSLMQKLLTKGIGHTEFREVKSMLGKYERIPKEWEIKKLDEIGKIISGGTPDSTNKEYWNGNILWATPTDITKLQTNQIENTERKITKQGLDNSSAKLLPKGTILITSRATIGECAIATQPIATNQGFQSIICNDRNFDRMCIFYLIRYHKSKLLRLAYGTTFLEINKSEIKKAVISIPALLSEQQKIASILSRVDAYIQKNQEYKKKIELLKKGLMQKLLTGQIRVKVDH